MINFLAQGVSDQITDYGWKGMCAVLVVVLIGAGKWVGGKLLNVIEQNTVAWNRVLDSNNAVMTMVQKVHEALLKIHKE